MLLRLSSFGMNGPKGDRKATVLLEIEELTCHMEVFQLKFTRREANEAAHLCAKQASEARRRCLWLNYIPVFLDICLQNDCKPDD
jgi:hypothetical protein